MNDIGGYTAGRERNFETPRSGRWSINAMEHRHAVCGWGPVLQLSGL